MLLAEMLQNFEGADWQHKQLQSWLQNFDFPVGLSDHIKKNQTTCPKQKPLDLTIDLVLSCKIFIFKPIIRFSQSRYYWYISFSTLVRRQSSFKVQSLLSNHIIPTKMIRYDNLFYPLPQAVLQAIKSSRLFECMKINPWRNCL